MIEMKEWDGFEGRLWKEEINVRQFIQDNYTPYDGDESFLADPTDATNKLWDALQKLQKEERAKGGVLDMETEVVTGITAYGPGYIDESLKDLEQIVGLQTDKPLKRAFMPYGGIKMAVQAAETYGYNVSDKLKEIFTKYHKTHNTAVFDAYTPEMMKVRHAKILTGLPDTYGRGRIVGDYRRVALYGLDYLIEEKKKDKANCGCGQMTDDVIRLREEIAEQIMEKKLELQKLTVTIQTGKGEMAKMESEIAETNSRLKLLELEERQLADQLSRAEGDIAKSKETLAQSEAAMAQANESLSAFQENLAEEKEQRDHLMEEITQVKIRISNSGQQIYAAEETVLRLQQEAENLQKETRQLHQQMELLRESGDKRGETQEALHAEREKLEQQEETLRQQLEETNALIASLTADTAELEEAVQTAADTATKLENELFRIETKQEKINEEKQRIFDRMWEEYEITIGAAKEASKEEKRPYGELKRLSKEWKNDMRALGNVNVGAIDQYREVKERFDFLTNQRADILEAEGKLRQIIVELTELMEKQFREQFAVISKNFSEVFQEMFGGGKAYLKLSDDANALESSIDIVAQPPGKSLQNMQLLSGGERALTAIAILFSILKMKPSPFCILDEIEAALDDANVRRYAQYLTRFSKETQFIVITHRKGTMEYADVMYGVTMQEKGVSKLISVDFSKAQEDVV